MMASAARLICEPFDKRDNPRDYQDPPKNHKNPAKPAPRHKSKVHHRIVSLIKSDGRRPSSHHHLHHRHKTNILRWKCDRGIATTQTLAHDCVHLFFTWLTHHSFHHFIHDYVPGGISNGLTHKIFANFFKVRVLEL